MTITIQPKPRVEPACMANPDLWYSTRPVDRALAVHICQQHCPLLDWCSQRPRSGESVQAGVLHAPNGQPAARQPKPRPVHCDTCRASTIRHTSTWDDCGQYKAYRRHVARGQQPCEPCIEARRERDRKRGPRRRPGATSPCGTIRGLQLHRAAGEPPCDVCVQAHREASAKGNAAHLIDDAVHRERVKLVRSLAGRGLSDPQIGAQLGMAVHRIRHLRKANGIPAGLSVASQARRAA